jgi:hypothetical protein
MIEEVQVCAVYTVPGDILRTSDDHDEMILTCREFFFDELRDRGYRLIDDSVQVALKPWYLFWEDAILIYVYAKVERA